MSKQSGLGDNLYVGGYNVSGDVGSLGRIGGGPSALEVTAIDKSGFERLGGLRDGAIEYSGFWNNSPLQLHAALSTLPTTDVILTYCRGTVLGNEAACMVAKEVSLDVARPNDGSLTVATQALPNGFGIEWGNQLTPGMTQHTTATNGTGIDTTASASFGAQAYLQVNSFTGTSATVSIQDSADNVSFAALTGTMAFAAVTSGPQAQRVTSAASTTTLRRYLRIATTGTFSELTFSVVIAKNLTATVF